MTYQCNYQSDGGIGQIGRGQQQNSHNDYAPVNNPSASSVFAPEIFIAIDLLKYLPGNIHM